MVIFDPQAPNGVQVYVRGQDEPMPQMFRALAGGPWLEGLTAGLVLLLGLIAAILALSTTIDTLGVVSPQVESRSRVAVAHRCQTTLRGR